MAHGPWAFVHKRTLDRLLNLAPREGLVRQSKLAIVVGWVCGLTFEATRGRREAARPARRMVRRPAGRA